MPVFETDSRKFGTSAADFMYGNGGAGGRETLIGLGGDDVIYGDLFSVLPAPGATPASAPDITAAIAWTTDSNEEIAASKTVPHATMVCIGDGTFHWLKLEATKGQTITLDIDYGVEPILGGSVGTDTSVELYKSDAQTVIAFNRDASALDGAEGSTSDWDSFLKHTFDRDGTYFIRVSEFAGDDPLDPSDNYLLNISLTGQPVSPGNTVGADLIFGGGGRDSIFGGGGNDKIHGGLGDDGLFGGPGNDLIFGDDGNDLLNGEGGADTLFGGKGDDSLVGAEGPDSLDGGGGNDWLSGGNDDDMLEGGNGADSLLGEAGNDLLSGGGYHDWLDGGAGSDTLFGGGGKDTLIGSGDDTLYGDSGNDLLSGTGSDLLYGGTGNDLLEGEMFDGGQMTLFGGAGNDTIKGGRNDNAYGGSGNDSISVNHGIAMGGPGNDRLIGTHNLTSDTLDGGDGDDVLRLRVSQSGVDVLTGGAGADRFVFHGFAYRSNKVTDFEVGVDKLEFTLSASGLGIGAFTDITFTDVTGGTKIQAASRANLSLTLEGVNSADLSESDFVFF